MRSDAAADTATGFFHETALYESDDEFLSIVVPFLLDGVAAGEPTLVRCEPHVSALLRDALGSPPGIAFGDGERGYANPAETIRSYRETFNELLAGGAERIRVVGSVPHPGVGVAWEGWARYEAAVNAAFARFPLWGLCPYDVRITPDDVIDDVHCVHPYVAGRHGDHFANPLYTDPETFVRARHQAPDPIESTPPTAALDDPTGAQAADLVDRITVGRVGGAHRASLGTVVSELVANAAEHGRPPTRLRVWIDDARTVITVNDRGTGPADPLAGLIPPRSRGDDGYGLWLAHLVHDGLVTRTDDDGFTVTIALDHDPPCAGSPT